MRHIVLTALLLVPFAASAQVGSVRYTHTYPVLYSHYFSYIAVAHQSMGEELAAPATHATVSRSMVFDATASLMYPTDKPHVEPGDRPAREGQEHIDTTYVDFGSGMYTESRVIDWREISLVSDQQPAIPWRLDGKERVYLGRRVMKATAVVDSAVVEAWFTPEIPIPAGPGLYGGLPGLILMVTNAASGEVYAAESLDMDVLPRAIAPPTRGRNMSDERYRRLRAREIADDRRRYEEDIRQINEGVHIFVKRGGQ